MVMPEHKNETEPRAPRRRSYDALDRQDVSPRDRNFPVPESWDEGLPADFDPEDRDHYRLGRRLRQILRDEEGIRPEDMYPTRDHRGVVKLTLRELYQLLFEPGSEPPLFKYGAPLTARPDPSKPRFGDAESVQHAQEVEQARQILKRERIFPKSVVPTQDFEGRVMLTFAQLAEILALDPEELVE
jgi:hypothetical protein